MTGTASCRLREKVLAVAASDTPIQPTSRAGSERSGPQGAFQGMVTGVKRENGSQTIEIQSAQGRIRLQAEGDFQVGEKLRVFVPQGGAIRIEKVPLPTGQPDWQGVSWHMRGNLTTLKSVRAFEEQLVNWVATRQPGATSGGLAQALGGGGDAESLLRLPLPELLKRVLAREGGREMLMQALAGLGKDGFQSLMAGLEEGGGTEGGKASILAMLRSMRRQIDSDSDTASASTRAGSPTPAGPGGTAPGRASAAPDLGAFWPGRPASPGEPAQPWMGRVLDRQEMGGAMAFAGGKPLPAMPRPSGPLDPMYRYTLDLGGRTLELMSAQPRDKGEFVAFEIEKEGARMQARFLDPVQSLPAGLRSAYGEAPAELKGALPLAGRLLAEFRNEPFFEKLVKDFGEVLAQGGRLALPPGGRLEAGNMPTPKELDSLLRLFVAFPRDPVEPARQARVWTEAARDPKAMTELLRTLKPDQETSLLRLGTPLRLTGLPPGLASLVLSGGADGASEAGDALVGLLRKVLPEGFKAPELLDLARQGLSPADSKSLEAKAAQFMLQAFAGLVPREDEMREGRPNQFYFYQGQEWKGLQVTWERDRGSDRRAMREPGAPVKVRVETEARHMGKVEVGVVLQGDKATLDFRNQFHDVGELLAEHMPELKKAAAYLGVHIDVWTYSRMPDVPNVPPTAGWVRPASLDGGNLDLVG